MSTFNKNLAYLFLISLSAAQLQAATVTDENSKQNTKVIQKDNVSIIDINTPTAKGVSVNDFKEFNVDGKGSVLNNSKTDYNTHLAGQISGNQNLTKEEADVVLLRVTGDTKTSLSAILEAAGQKKLTVYIANENGIKVDGAEFLNIDKAVLTTGAVDADLNITVNKGEIEISSKGIKGARLLDIITSAQKNLGKMVASDKVKVLLGHNKIDKDGNVTVLNSSSIDGSELGSIYSGQIEIVATADGVGVNSKELLAKKDININTKGKLENTGKIASDGNVVIKVADLVNKGQVNFDANSYEIKWITKDGKVLTLDDINKVWAKKYDKVLTSDDTFIMLTGSLLNQWTYDPYAKTMSPNANLEKRFRDVLAELNTSVEDSVLLKNPDKISEKQISSTFVNKGDIYATEMDNQKILNAVAVSKVMANQAIIDGKNVNIEATNKIQNKDAKISAKENLNVKANTLTNENSISDEIELRDGYEQISWEIMPKYIGKKIVDSSYDVHYERGLVAENSGRKTRIAAANNAKLEAKNIKLNVDNLNIKDEINTGVGISAKENLNIESKNMALKGQAINAANVDVRAKEINLENGLISGDNITVNAEKLGLATTKEKETVIKTDKEDFKRDIVYSSAIGAKNKLNINANEVDIKGSILQADDSITVNSNKVSIVGDIASKDYKSEYDISKSYRKVKHNESVEDNVASYVKAKKVSIKAEKMNTKGSALLATDKLEINSKNTTVDVAKTKQIIDKKIGIDNGFLGVNYNKVKQEKDKAVGSLLQSKEDISAKVDEELKIIGSRVSGGKVHLDAGNVSVTGGTTTTVTDTESRHLLAGEELNGSVDIVNDKDKSKVTVDMDVYKKETKHIKQETNNKAEITGDKVDIVAKDKVTVEGSNIKGKEVNIDADKVNIKDKKETTKIEVDSTKHSIKAEVGVDNGAKKEVSGGLDYKIEHKKETQNEVTSDKSEITGDKVDIVAKDKVTVEGSDITAKDLEIVADKMVEIKNSVDTLNYTKNLDKVTLGMKAKGGETLVKIVTSVKDLIDEKEKIESYVKNPLSALANIKEIKANFEKKYNEVKTMIETFKDSNVNLEDAGLGVTVDGKISYDKEYITKLSEISKQTNIKADKINITSNDKVNIAGSKIDGKEVNINADTVNINSSVDKINANQTNVHVGVSGSDNIVTNKTDWSVEAGVNNKGNYSKENKNTEISGDKVNINANKEVNISGVDVVAKDGKIKSDTVNMHTNVDSDVKYGVGINGNVNSSKNYNVNGNAKVAGVIICSDI